MGGESSRASARLIVADTGPLLHLTEAGVLHLLPLLGRVCIPPAVASEAINPPIPAVGPTGWISLETLPASAAAEAAAWCHTGLLHAGEAEAIALAKSLSADWFLTDDAAARLFATSLHIETHGSLGVVLACARLALLSEQEAERALIALSQSSLWVSESVFAEARRALAHIAKGS